MRPVNAVSEIAVDLTPSGGVSGLISGGVVYATISEPTIYPIQVLGFVPLVPCAPTECRTFNGDCYFNPAFGKINVNGSTYENDVNPFYILDEMARKTFWWIQKLDTTLGQWSDLARVGASTGLGGFITDPNYGTYWNYGTWPTHPKQQGYQINWGYVLTTSGPGKYRIRVETPPVIDTRPQPFPYCQVSEPFDMHAWNCERANGTVKFESYNSGRIGSITNDGLVYDLCGMTLYDSLRHRGFFGHEKTSYDEIMLEFQTGKMERVRDEAIQKFTYSSRPMPKYVHDRFKVYGMMADYTYVSDYNWNNSDYEIRRKSIVKSAGYEPTYYKGNRLMTVKTEFKEGIQGVIKSSSCPPVQ